MGTFLSKRKINLGILFICLVFLGFSASSQQPVRDSLCAIVESQVGIREKTGNNDGMEVEMYLRSVGLGKGYAWCAAFTTWCHDQVGIPNPQSAWSPNWGKREKQLLYMKNGLNLQFPVKSGCVFTLYYSNLKRIGHVGFIMYEDANYYYTIEGNTNASGSRLGDGVYKKKRSKKSVYTISDFVAPAEVTEQYNQQSPEVEQMSYFSLRFPFSLAYLFGTN